MKNMAIQNVSLFNYWLIEILIAPLVIRRYYPANIYLLKAAIETLEKGVKYILVFLSLTLNIFPTFFSVSFIDFEQVNNS